MVNKSNYEKNYGFTLVIKLYEPDQILHLQSTANDEVSPSVLIKLRLQWALYNITSEKVLVLLKF